MKLLGIRFCHVAPAETAEAVGRILGEGLGLASADIGLPAEPFSGAIYPAGDSSWVELWPSGEGMPPGTMLQLVVDDADAFAAHARGQGVEPSGPVDAHGERIYYVQAPGGLAISFQSKLADNGQGT